MAEAALPELAAVPWRGRIDARYLQRRGWLWTLQTVAFVVPFTAAGIFLIALEPLALPVALASFAHGWVIPELTPSAGRTRSVRRAARVTRMPSRSRRGCSATCWDMTPATCSATPGWRWSAARSASGCSARRAVLVANGGKRVHCFCVGTTDRDLPPSDRIAHLLLALRTDEEGFATVANHAFSGAPWRLRRRIRKEQRRALKAAVAKAALIGLERRHRRWRVRRALRGAAPRARAPAPQRADHGAQRHELPPLRRSCRARRRARSNRGMWSSRSVRSSTGPTSSSDACLASTRH